MKTLYPEELENREVYQFLTGAVTPRPIAFASTISADGVRNLSPYSFFNVFGPNPPTLVFSPVRRGRDNTTKDTLNNVEETGEVVINVVSWDIVQQMSLASTEYDPGIDEFVKAGFTPVPSLKVKPPRVAESKVHFECTVNDIIPLGKEGGAGNLVICEVVCFHVAEEVLNDTGQIDPHRLDAVGRLGEAWYVRVNGEAVFEVPRPGRDTGIGVDAIPKEILDSDVLTGNDLGRLAGVSQLPAKDKIRAVGKELGLETYLMGVEGEMEQQKALQQMAKGYIEKGDLAKAWAILMFHNPGSN